MKEKGKTVHCNKYMIHRFRSMYIEMDVLSVSVVQDRLDSLEPADFINDQCLVPPGHRV